MAIRIENSITDNYNAPDPVTGLPRKNQVLNFVDDSNTTVASIHVPADGSTPYFEIDAEQAVTTQTVYSRSVTLTDAQIKALQQTDVQLVAAQGPNTLIIPTDFIWDLNPSGGAYTNVTAFETVRR